MMVVSARDDVGVRATTMKVTKTMSASSMPSSDAPSRPVFVTPASWIRVSTRSSCRCGIEFEILNVDAFTRQCATPGD